jgi:hypothetical protein
VQVRFRANDAAPDSIVEAGIDVFEVVRFVCDTCQQTFPLLTVGNASMSMCGGDLSPGTFTTLSVTNLPASAFALLVFDVLPNPSPFAGGELISPAPVVLGQLFVDGSGNSTTPLPLGGLLPPGWSLYAQTVYLDGTLPQGTGVTNALQVTWN